MSRLCNNMYGINITSKQYQKRINKKELRFYKYYLDFKDNPILDYIVIKCRKYQNSELFEPFKQFIKDKEFKYSHIHNFKGNYIDCLENSDNYMFIDDNNSIKNQNKIIDDNKYNLLGD